jgi:DNA polymerase-3 subunit alpha
MTEPCFVHLRAHTEFSISDSIVRLDALVAAAAADNQPAVAITDLSNVFGWIKFYKAARKRGVKPLLGVDCWLTNARDRDRAHRILLLVRNRQGYLRLCQLLSRAWIENEWRGRGELLPEWFDEGAESVNDGLIGLSGAMHGDVGQALLAGNEELAAQLAQRWQQRFGGDYFIELQRSGRPEDETCTRASARLASRLDVPVVATHPVQFMERGHFQAHEARVCIAQGEILANPRRARQFFPEQYFKSQSEMAELFSDLPEALANAVEIARRCNLEMVLDKPQLPAFPTPEGVTLDDYLGELARAGLDERLAAMPGDESEAAPRRQSYRQRLEYECAMIAQMGFSGYFLIVADFINWAKANRVPVGPGRGSGAGSLVAYALGITDLDPIPYGLLFERFLNPERVSLPDFDIDFCQDRRHLVIDYVRSKYGADAVSQIATFGTMASRAVIRDVGRVLDMGYNFCDQLSKLIPVEQNKPLSLAKAREREEQLRERERKEVEVRELLALAEPLEDLAVC